ncbi:DMT family transporter [Solemya velum gill symbiont]|uniref:DMT family transporter n=1 Tax=Solemya velum gill symbiont TaxID=2340 RepID=UPI000997306B|nr:DMT family transporter [Solemya velum gill symbiont]OOY51276.1 EamA family transporter [Solemya velum gill symbiont]OOY55247.1 EamA family transporter [Solemya velum gill symbiont]OOY56443.1 EamA family transporter [Solemya velum gill symbiont]OOY59743.1 EamA family transporter [Solemya velum gill symbiont]OOY62087.1 EamA family transporter [Solemya velum gill symbiont]
MSVPAAYLGMVLIWTTTPLAIKWSSEGIGPWLGVSTRMLLGVFVCLVLVALMSRRMRWYAAARKTYLAAGLGIWGAMSSVYWGAQFIPSGMVSVVFGLTPVVTGLFAALILHERGLTLFRGTGMLLGISGLWLVFEQSLRLGNQQYIGLLAVGVSVVIHSLSAVWIKRIDAGLHPLETTTGALLVAVPLFWVSYGFNDADADVQISERALWSILYLGAVATAFGFVLYYYVLREISATAIGLATMVTPVLALLLGAWLNHERISAIEMLGTGVILAGLASYQWGDQLMRKKTLVR